MLHHCAPQFLMFLDAACLTAREQRLFGNSQIQRWIGVLVAALPSSLDEVQRQHFQKGQDLRGRVPQAALERRAEELKGLTHWLLHLKKLSGIKRGAANHYLKTGSGWTALASPRLTAGVLLAGPHCSLARQWATSDFIRMQTPQTVTGMKVQDIK